MIIKSEEINKIKENLNCYKDVIVNHKDYSESALEQIFLLIDRYSESGDHSKIIETVSPLWKILRVYKVNNGSRGEDAAIHRMNRKTKREQRRKVRITGLQKGFERNPKKYTVDEVISKVGTSTWEFDGDKIKMNSQRLRVFRESTLCTGCGLTGSVFFKEKGKKDRYYHFNLYAIDKSERYILMTKDHKIPKSKGGPNKMTNYQTMCIYCNKAKADKLDT